MPLLTGLKPELSFTKNMNEEKRLSQTTTYSLEKNTIQFIVCYSVREGRECVKDNKRSWRPRLSASLEAMKSFLWRYGLSSNPGEDMDVYKGLVSLRQGGTVNRCVASPLGRLVGGKEMWEAPYPPP
ncbi:hypothetical protein TNCV_4440821 [Trichonephila clavipes]|nr:hypothetical protein TNCV_4440821 [Trichonephila clavipes]